MLITRLNPLTGFRHAAIFLALIFVCASASALTADAAMVSVERAWIDRARVLVNQAATGRADGSTYTQDVRAHRADLRNLMRSSGKGLPQQHQQLHMSMVLLGVLLKTAAGCQSGGHVVCPASLMTQLRTVLKNTYLKLDIHEEQHLASRINNTTR